MLRTLEDAPNGVKSNLSNGMTALTQIETRIKSDSGIANYQGIDISVSHSAYMDYVSGKGSLEVAATTVAADIGQAVATGQLSAAEVSQLQGVLAGLTGNTKLAEAFVGQMVAGAYVDSGMVSAHMDEGAESGYNEEQRAKDSGGRRVVPPAEIKIILENEGLTQDAIDNIVALPKGKKPKPEKYLSKKYIAEHLQSFKDSGAVKIMPTEPTGTIGGKGGTFVMSGDQLDSIIKSCKGDISKIEDALGFDRGYLGNDPVIVEIHNISGLRMPNGNEIGAFPEYWLPGGFTIGGIKEAVVDPASVGTYTYRHLF